MSYGYKKEDGTLVYLTTTTNNTPGTMQGDLLLTRLHLNRAYAEINRLNMCTLMGRLDKLSGCKSAKRKEEAADIRADIEKFKQHVQIMESAISKNEQELRAYCESMTIR